MSLISIGVLGGGTDSIKLIEHLRFLEAQILLIDKNNKCAAFSFCDQFVECSTHSFEKILEKLPTKKVDFFLTRSSGFPAVTATKLNSFFFKKIASNSIIVDGLQNKKKISQTVEKKITTPKIWSVKDVYNQTECNLFVVKPIYEKVGKITTFKVNKENLEVAIKRASKNSHISECVIQEYLDGQDYSIFGFVVDGVYKHSYILEELNSWEDNKIVASGFSKCYESSLNNELLKIGRSLGKLIGGYTPFNYGVRVQDLKVVLLECNFDFGGEKVWENRIGPPGEYEADNFLNDLFSKIKE